MDIATWTELNERVQQAKHSDDRALIAEVIVDLNQRTADGTPIRLGLEVIDYNRNRTTVKNVSHIELHGTVWFDTANGGLFDGSRMQAVR